MNVQLALYKGKGQVGNALIRWWTGSIYSHCELVVDGRCYSSSVMDKGVRSKAVGPGEHEISLAPENWDILELPWANANQALEHFRNTDGYRYGWPSLIASQIFNRNHQTKKAAFCSEWAASALSLPSPASYSPRTLGEIAGWLTGYTLNPVVAGPALTDVAQVG